MKLTVAILLIIISSFCSSHYIKGQCVEIFSYTANSQTWVVPLGVTNIQIECWGAQGGDSESCISGGPNPQVDGGLGGYSKGLYTVTPGDVLYIYMLEENPQVVTLEAITMLVALMVEEMEVNILVLVVAHLM